MDTDEGVRRRSLLNYDYTVVTGVSGIHAPSWMQSKFAGRHKDSTKAATVGAFYGHYTAWSELVKRGDTGGLILEDDAFQCREDIDYQTLPKGSLTMLGGTLRTEGTWKNESKEWLKGQFLPRLATLKPGLNLLGSNKMTMALAYWVPAGFAAHLMAKARSETIRPIDAWLVRHKLVQWLYFPNLFIDHDASISQCNTDKNELMSDLYANRNMRRAALKIGFEFPQRGCDVQVFYNAYQAFNKASGGGGSASGGGGSASAASSSNSPITLESMLAEFAPTDEPDL